MTEQSTNNYGWQIIRSATMDLDVGLAMAGGSFPRAGITSDILALQENPDDWKAEWQVYFGNMGWFSSVLEYAGFLAGVLDESDYSKATMAVRRMTLEAATENIQKMVSTIGLDHITGSTPEDTLIQNCIAYRKYGFESIQLVHPRDRLFENRMVRELQLCIEILQGGRHHDAFWHWLDRFYYGVYQNWLDTRKPYLTGQEQKLVSMVGASQGEGKPVNLLWLPDVNPALRYPEVKSAIDDGTLRVKFWLEPFGMADSFTLLPGNIYLSFAEPGQIYENFMAYTKTMAGQVQALADPTRLIILRLIRVLSMTNTDMAAYLGLSRPTVSIHARILREAGLIHSWEEGRITRHEINPEAVRNLFSELESFLDLPPEKRE
jgi:DNA-binding transcriptional ArsR family regulator